MGIMTQEKRPVHGTLPGPWTPERVKDMLQKSRRFVERAIFVLHYRQSPEQQDGADTGDHDRIGFNRWDKAGLLGDFARQMEASTLPEGHRLTDKQLAAAVPKLRKYAGQLSDLANLRLSLERETFRMTGVCQRCHGKRFVTETVFGRPLEQPCPVCGDAPIVR
jgi:hypothetical protein